MVMTAEDPSIPTTPCVEEGDTQPQTPAAACGKCKEEWERSVVESAASQVQWEEVIVSDTLVSFVFCCFGLKFHCYIHYIAVVLSYLVFGLKM